MSNALQPLFEACATDIKVAYDDLGHSLGWRFLTGPRGTLNADTEIAFISLNPAGGPADAHQTGPSYETGSAYVTEAWGHNPRGQATLQRQVQALFAELIPHRGEEGPVETFLAQHVLTAHFVPFRSPSLAALHERERSVAFARQLWARILGAWQPRLILTIDRYTSDAFHDILTSHLKGMVVDAAGFDTGWGRYQADATRYRLPDDGRRVTVGRLPHLSRFTLFSEPGYALRRKQALAPFFHYLTA